MRHHTRALVLAPQGEQVTRLHLYASSSPQPVPSGTARVSNCRQLVSCVWASMPPRFWPESLSTTSLDSSHVLGHGCKPPGAAPRIIGTGSTRSVLLTSATWSTSSRHDGYTLLFLRLYSCIYRHTRGRERRVDKQDNEICHLGSLPPRWP